MYFEQDDQVYLIIQITNFPSDMNLPSEERPVGWVSSLTDAIAAVKSLDEKHPMSRENRDLDQDAYYIWHRHQKTQKITL